MDNLLEILVPVLFAAIYFFGNMFSKKSEDDVAPGAPSRGEDPEAAERQRRIQEEIRRKIMERRNATGGGASDSSRGRSSPELSRQGQPQPLESARQERHHETQTSSSTPYAPRPAPAAPYQTQMQDRLKKIEATRRQAEKLQKQAGSSRSATGVQAREIGDHIGRSAGARTSGHRRPRFGGSVRSTLRDPAAARTAFIYAEVLGPPVSQKKASTVPGLS